MSAAGFPRAYRPSCVTTTRCISSFSNAPAEHDADLAPGCDAAPHLLLDDARWRTHADVLRDFVPVERRKARQVALDQRLHGREIEAPHEDEGEVARIGEAVLVEGERLVEVHLRDARRRQRLRAQDGSGSMPHRAPRRTPCPACADWLASVTFN